MTCPGSCMDFNRAKTGAHSNSQIFLNTVYVLEDRIFHKPSWSIYDLLFYIYSFGSQILPLSTFLQKPIQSNKRTFPLQFSICTAYPQLLLSAHLIVKGRRGPVSKLQTSFLSIYTYSTAQYV